MVHADEATFEGNRRDVEFMSYKFNTGTGNIVQNKSRFISTRFTSGNNIQPGAATGVSIWETDGIEFNQCSFDGKWGDAISTYDAGIIVKNGCYFSGCDKGIATFATYPMSSMSRIGEVGTSKNGFDGCNIAIDGSLASGIPFWPSYNDGQFAFDIINNDFQFNWLAELFSTALVIIG